MPKRIVEQPEAEHASGQDWATRWLSSVTDASMTQRRLSSVERYGGLAALERAAKAQGVHLLQLTDDNGNVIIAASKSAFKVIC